MPDFHIPTDAEIAAEARRIILADLSVYDSIPVLAKKAGTNPFTLKTVFKKYYGVSVFKFSRQERMEEAKRLLRETNYTLQTIAEQVGYAEGSNFQAAFKTVVGMAPGQWRRGSDTFP